MKRDRTISLSLVLPLALLALCLGGTADTAAAQPASCLTQPTLDGFVTCVKGYMVPEESEGYVAPPPAELAAFRTVVGDMMTQACAAVTLPASLQGIYTVAAFSDGGRSYCVLVETADADTSGAVDRGWGTVVVDNGVDTKRLSIDVPHPLHDSGTPEQGIAVFKGVKARTFVMAGAHREANAAHSPCQDDYQVADAAHNAAHTFTAAAEAILAAYASAGQAHTAIQFHGMADDTCPGVDAYLTHGVTSTPLPNSVVRQLKDHLKTGEPAGAAWSLVVPGDALECELSGTKNVQGRLLNGVPCGAACDQRAYQYTGRFVHIEQTQRLRAPAAYSHWIAAINDLDFSIVPQPPANWITSPNGGETWERGTTETITWTAQNTTAPVKLALLKNGSHFKKITDSAPNTGSFDWYVPVDFEEGVYTVRVISTADDDMRDFSDAPFSISHGPNSPEITLTSPNGGETWVRNTDQTVTWTSQNVPGNVFLGLYQGTKLIRKIAETTPNDGAHTWRVPISLATGVYTVRVRSVDDDDIRDDSDGTITVALAAAAQRGPVTAGVYPNPFNPATTIRYALPADAHVTVRVFDMLGREVATLVDGAQHAGNHEARFDASTRPSGVYLYRIETDGFVQTGRMLLVK